MKRVVAIAKKEMQSYFDSPIAYVVLGVFLLVLGYLYFSTLFLGGFASLRNFFSFTPMLFVVFAPALTMRLIAEERKSGTIEHLLTLPVTDTQVVLGKFMAAVGTLGVGIMFTIPYAITVAFLTPEGLSMDLGPVIGGYFGLVFLAASFVSLGLLASSLTKNQIIAFVIGLAICFFFFFIDKFAVLMPTSIGPFFEYLSVDYHFNNFSRGVIDTRDLLFYVSVTAISLLLTVNLLRLSRN